MGGDRGFQQRDQPLHRARNWRRRSRTTGPRSVRVRREIRESVGIPDPVLENAIDFDGPSSTIRRVRPANSDVDSSTRVDSTTPLTRERTGLSQPDHATSPSFGRRVSNRGHPITTRDPWGSSRRNPLRPQSIAVRSKPLRSSRAEATTRRVRSESVTGSSGLSW